MVPDEHALLILTPVLPFAAGKWRGGLLLVFAVVGGERAYTAWPEARPADVDDGEA